MLLLTSLTNCAWMFTKSRCENIHSNTICRDPKMETTLMAINSRMNKNIEYSFNRLLEISGCE